jgi:hypothetical protein
MKYATRDALAFASLSVFTSAGFGQTTSVVAQQQPTASAAAAATCSGSFGPVMAMAAPGPTAPYSAVQESSNVQTLADGTHITHKTMSEKIFRDSQGRTRTERPLCLGPAGVPDVVVIEIRDPVSGYSFILDEQNQVAHRFALQIRHPAAPPARPANAGAVETLPKTSTSTSETLRPTVTRESLGSQTMEGVPVEGTRMTEVIPEGLQGNDRPITVVRESWTSPDLKVVILMKNNDPRRGEMMMRLTNIDLSNPILSLFQPPLDYKIVDETERVTLTFTRP